MNYKQFWSTLSAAGHIKVGADNVPFSNVPQSSVPNCLKVINNSPLCSYYLELQHILHLVVGWCHNHIMQMLHCKKAIMHFLCIDDYLAPSYIINHTQLCCQWTAIAFIRQLQTLSKLTLTKWNQCVSRNVNGLLES